MEIKGTASASGAAGALSSRDLILSRFGRWQKAAPPPESPLACPPTPLAAILQPPVLAATPPAACADAEQLLAEARAQLASRAADPAWIEAWRRRHRMENG